MRHDTKAIDRVSKQQRFTLQPWELEPQQIIILVDKHPGLPRVSILCAFVQYERKEDKITVLVANGLLSYLYSNSDLVFDPNGLYELITFKCSDVLIHDCIG